MDACFRPSEDANNVQELGEDGAIAKHWSYDHVFGEQCSNAFVYTLLVIAAFVFIFLIWYAKQTFGGSKRSSKTKRK